MKRVFIVAAVALITWSQAYSGKTKEIDRHIPVQASDRLDVRGFSGSKIDFKSWDKSEVYLKLKISVLSSNEDYESDFINNVDIESNRTESALLILLKQPSMSGRNGFSWSNLFKLKFVSYNSIEITGEVYLPRNNPTILEAKYSDVSLEDMRGELTLDGSSSTIRLKNCASVQKIDNDYGTTAIAQCGGRLRLKGAGSHVTIEKFDGRVDLDADYSTIQLRDITKSTVVRSKSSSSIVAERIGESLSIEADYSTLKISDVKGSVDIGDKSGVIRVSDVEGLRINAPYSHIDISTVTLKSKRPLSIESTSGEISLEDVNGDVSLESPYTSIDLTGIRGNVSIDAKSCQVHLDEIVGDMTIKSEYAGLYFRNITADNVVLSNKSGQIEFEAKNSPSRIDIRNEYGNVNLRLPANYSADMNLKVSYGTIKCNLPLALEELGGGAFFTGKFGNGGKSSLKVSTSSGDIVLKIR